MKHIVQSDFYNRDVLLETLGHTQMKAKTFHRHYCASPPSDRLIKLPLRCSPWVSDFHWHWFDVFTLSLWVYHITASIPPPFPGSAAPMGLWFIVLSNSYMSCILCMRCKNAIHLKRAAAALLPLWRESVCKGIFYKLHQHDGFHLLSLCSFVQLDFSISISGIDSFFFFHIFLYLRMTFACPQRTGVNWFDSEQETEEKKR